MDTLDIYDEDGTGRIERERPASVDDGAAFPWVAVAPLAATALGVAVGLLVGFDIYDTGSPGDVALAPYVALVPYFLVCLAGTLWLFEDADRLAASGADWQPNPWPYVLGGALVLEAVVAAPVVSGTVTTDVVPYLAGGFVLAVLLSSVVAGPVYLLARHRALGEP